MSGATAEPRSPRVVLVGAGHAHLEILRRLADRPTPPFTTTIVSLEERHFYSGMTPGYLAGQYRLDDLTVALPAIAGRAGADIVLGRAAGLDPIARRVDLDDGGALPYDLVSLNVGSLLAGGDSPAARLAERIKPLHRVERLQERLLGLATATADEPAAVVVVGAGAAGVEVACASAALLRRHGRRAEVSLVESGECILPAAGDRLRSRAEEALAALGVRCHTGRSVTAVEEGRVLFDGGGPLRADLAIWLTGPAAAPFLAASGLPVDGRGFLWTDEHLRSIADERVFAVGDCGTQRDHPNTPKAGVYAVRQAPVLWRNLCATARGEELATYRPQSGFLSILNTCDGKALLHYRGFVSWSRPAWWLKDRIDRRFMARYQRLADSSPPRRRPAIQPSTE